MGDVKLNKGFYDGYLKIDDAKTAKTFKDKFIMQLTKGVVYKFFGFNSDREINEKKLKCTEENLIWGSYYKFFEDINDCAFSYNAKTVSRMTGESIEKITWIFQMMREMYNICCFTCEQNSFMWQKYGGSYNGYCIEYELTDGDYFLPVLYTQQPCADISVEIAESIKALKRKDIRNIHTRFIATMPYVLKDLKYSKENEIRIRVSPYDDKNGTLGGRVFPGKKDLMDYKGEAFSIEKIGLKVRKVIIGNKCSKEINERLIAYAKKCSVLYEQALST